MPAQPPNDAVRIFLAYAREDFDAVSAIYDRLTGLGLKPWMDKRDLLPGQNWEVHLARAIQESHFFLACFSAKSVEKRGYLQKEFKQALDLWQEKLNSDIYLIPVRLDECEVPEQFRAFQWANLHEKDGWPALLRAIREGAKQQGLPVPKGLVDLPPDYYRRRIRARSPWLLAALAAIVVVTIAILAYAVGLIPPRQQPPAPTTPLAGEESGKEMVGAISAVPPTPTQTPTGIPTSGVTSTPTPTSTLTLEPLTPTPLPALPDNVLFTDNGATVKEEPVSMELVRIPAGEFLMGSDPAKDSTAGDDEKPQHRVTLSEFYVGKHEVTNAQYAVFVRATGHAAPSDWENGNMPAGKEDHPVVHVSWNDSTAFTQWLSEETGRAFRLCTEAEWEKACRGESGLIYPWGDAFDASRANTDESGIGTTTSAGKYSPAGDSLYGASDMAGNAWEWVADWYGGDYYSSSLSENPQGPKTGDTRVVRGGSFYFNARSARCADRYFVNAGNRSVSFGFRVCMSPWPLNPTTSGPPPGP